MSESTPNPQETSRTRIAACVEDARSSIVAAAFAGASFAVLEFFLTVAASPTFPNVSVLFRFAMTTAALAALLVIPLTVALFFSSLALRTGAALLHRTPWPSRQSLFAARSERHNGSAAALLWGGSIFVLTFVGGSSWLIKTLAPRFKEPLLTAGLISITQLLVIAVAAALAALTIVVAKRAAGTLERRLSSKAASFNPFSHPIAAAVVLLCLAVAATLAVLAGAPNLRPLIPWRLGASGLAITVGLIIARRRPWPPVFSGRRRAALIAASVFLIVVPVSLVTWGGEPRTKALAVTSSPALALLVDGVRRVNDIDGDGYGSLLGESDCAPFDDGVHPLAPEVPDNGRDENCDGRDLNLAQLSTSAGATPPVPAGFERKWNILLITVDTVRYDHTSFGGYIEKRKRDTTPNLAELVRRSASFSFCNAPSAGTMASIPATLTSKFFHSGIALGPNRKGMPPITKPENLLVAEILKDAGYKTGAILTHHYFNDWGLEQGFDTYDNSIGEKSKPRDVSSDRVTDRAVSWIANSSSKPWFLWTHYLDPHGRYVSHPGEVSYGTSEEDIYDGELHFTDKHLGRLFREIARIPGVAENTVIILTSDHGDAFNEHGFINHGQALYRELLWVPLIIYVPSIQPRVIPGPVSPLDIVPTVLDLIGVDRSRFSFEGQSLVPQLFYGQDARDRIVFAETDWPKPQRAVISDNYKLIRKLQDNLFELYDLKKDPLEKKNIYSSNKAAFNEMNAHLESWLERVYYARDAVANQQMLQLKDVLLSERPTPAKRLSATLDAGRLELLGFAVEPALNNKKQPADKLNVSLYFAAIGRPSGDFKIQVLAWPSDGEPSKAKKSSASLTAKGRLPSSRWRPGEFVVHQTLVRTAGGKPPEGSWSFAVKITSKGTALAPLGLETALQPGAYVLGTIELEAANSVQPREKPGQRGSPPAPTP